MTSLAFSYASCLVSAVTKILVSSANSTNSPKELHLTMSFIYIENRSGPRTEP